MSKPKNQKVAIILALVGAATPLAGLHKFYLKQPLWGVLYLALFSTPIPHVASGIEALWYLLQDRADFERRFGGDLMAKAVAGDTTPAKPPPEQVGAIATALRELDRLRQEGLMSEYEFEEKRRQLLDRIA